MSYVRYDVGVEGEKIALQYLEKKRYRLITTRFRYGQGEIDLIMRDGKTIVFVEVKYRKAGKAGDGLMAVTKAKQKRMRSCASWYALQKGVTDAVMRFDVVEITADGILHIENAF